MSDPVVEREMHELRVRLDAMETTQRCTVEAGDISEAESENCWLWSLIIFLIQRSLISAVFIPHEVFTTQKYVHSSTRGSADGGYPLCGVRGAYPPCWGVWGQAGPQQGFMGEAPEAKIAL